MFSRQYTDSEPSAIQAYPEHNPLNIFVRERSYQWTDDDFDDFVGIDYEITNVGPNALDDVYFGIFLDGDVGNRNTPGYNEDDVVGFVRIPAVCTDYGGVSLDYGYVADATSSSTMGVMILDHVTDPGGFGFAPPGSVGRHSRTSTAALLSRTAAIQPMISNATSSCRERTIERDGTVPRDYRILLSVDLRRASSGIHPDFQHCAGLHARTSQQREPLTSGACVSGAVDQPRRRR
jgi:hypothetical protein